MAEVPYTQTGTLDSVMQTYYDKRLLEATKPMLRYAQLGDKRPIPKNSGKVVFWTKYTNLTANTTAITEGNDITAEGMSATTVSATVAHYGRGVTVSELLSLTAFSDPVAEAVDKLGLVMADTIDQVVRDEAITIGATNSVVASGVTHYSSLIETDVLTVSDLRKGKRVLDGNDAPLYDAKGYVGVIHSDVVYDLEGDDNWVGAHQYTEAGIQNLYNGEVGQIYGMRFLTSTNASVMTNSGSAGAVDVYRTLIVGKGAYAISDLQALRTVVNSPAKGSEQGLYSYIGADLYFTSKVLDTDFGVVIDSAATQL